MLVRAEILLVFLLLHFLAGAVLRNGGGYPLFYTLILRASKELARRLNRQTKSRSELMLRGTLVILPLVFFSILLGYAFSNIAQYKYGFLSLLLCLFLTVSMMASLKTLRAISDLLKQKQNKEARKRASHDYTLNITAIDDAHGIARVAVTQDAKLLCAQCTGPIFWFIIAGVPGLFVSSTVLAIGKSFAQYGYFSAPVRFIDKSIHFIPNIATIVLISISAIFVSRAHPLYALKAALKETPLSAHVLPATAAGALGVTLGGPPFEKWIGNEGTTAKISTGDMQRAAMMRLVFILCLIVCNSVFVLMLSTP